MSRRNGSMSRAAETAHKTRLHMDRNPQHPRITDPSNPAGRRKEIDNVMKRARKGSPGTWDRKLLEAEEKDPNRWRHSGYKQLYLDGSRSPSPGGRRSRSPIGRRSRSPMVRRSRSPVGRRSRSPIMARRSRSPVVINRRSPLRRSRSRSNRRTPPRRPSPVRRAVSPRRSPRREKAKPKPIRNRPPSPPEPRQSSSGSSSGSCSDDSCSVCSAKNKKSKPPTKPMPPNAKAVPNAKPVPPTSKGARPPQPSAPVQRNRGPPAPAPPTRELLKAREASKRSREEKVLEWQRSQCASGPAPPAGVVVKREGEKKKGGVSPAAIRQALYHSDSESSRSNDNQPQRLTLSERFGKMAQWSQARSNRVENMRITRRDRGLHVIMEPGAEAVPEGEMEPAPVGCYPEELLAVAPTGLSWDDVTVRYDYYKERGYLRGLTLGDYVKWEQWWYKYQEWLKRSRAYSLWSEGGSRRERRRRSGRGRRS